MSKLKIAVIIGSTRDSRFGPKPAEWIFELAKKRADLDVELVDLARSGVGGSHSLLHQACVVEAGVRRCCFLGDGLGDRGDLSSGDRRGLLLDRRDGGGSCFVITLPAARVLQTSGA